MTADGHTKRRILLCSMRYGLRTQSAPLVRGSSRRIMTLRFRPAYIRDGMRRPVYMIEVVVGASTHFKTHSKCNRGDRP
jgi:hypothetical protein